MNPTIVIGSLLGFATLFSLTHDTHRSSFKRKLPNIKLKNFELCPNIKVNFKHYQMHLHHWVALGLLFIMLSQLIGNIVDTGVVKGFFIGGVAQGLTYKDRFHFLKRL